MGSASISGEVEGVKERALTASIWGFDGASQTTALLEIEFSSFDGGHHNKRASRSGRRRSRAVDGAPVTVVFFSFVTSDPTPVEKKRGRRCDVGETHELATSFFFVDSSARRCEAKERERRFFIFVRAIRRRDRGGHGSFEREREEEEGERDMDWGQLTTWVGVGVDLGVIGRCR